jgi:diaminohydroxyphosphoribosylaminopyrimidine deaminase/5-amino-6-(5-phosphoribosylamino)uracil reductase
MLQDKQFMKRAIELGVLVRGNTGDNPNVGCVIVKEGAIIGEGATQPPGEPHAEIMAMRFAKRQKISVAHSALYSTVEPCSFYGRTPPCVHAIIEARIARVVIGMLDPHPLVNGKSVEMLRNAGIVVTEGVCENEVRAYLREWLKRYEQ